MADKRIKDLATFSGEPGGSDWLAIDSASETKKIAGNQFALNSKRTLNVKQIGSETDLNDLMGNSNTGFYYITNGVVNSPTSWATLLVSAYNSATFQIIENRGNIWWRDFTGSPSAWSEWKRASGSDFLEGETFSVEDTFVGKGTNDGSGYYGAVTLPKTIPTGKNVEITEAIQYGVWASDGQSHTLDLSNIGTITPRGSLLWFKIPATAVQTNSIAWVRIVVKGKITS